MLTRVVTKIGDVYQTPTGRILQLVAIDIVDMNSDVVVVYEDIPGTTLKDIPSLPIDFYHHSIISLGVKKGLWSKIGKAPLPDTSKILFKQYFGQDMAEGQADYERMYGSDETAPPIPYPNWVVWSLNDTDWHYVTEKAGSKIKAEDGGIVPPDDIIYRIEHGVSKFKIGWPD